MNFIFSPARIDIVVSVDPATRDLIDRTLSLIEGAAQTQIDALTNRLDSAKGELARALAANPDPNPND